MEIQDKNKIRTLTYDELCVTLEGVDNKSYKIKQIYEWLWKKGVTSFDQMSNVSKEHRQYLEEHFAILPAEKETIQKSKDGTIKIAFKLFDNKYIESVLIPSNDRLTACISSQVGCPIGCLFCATGKLGYHRNLTAGEIYDQVIEMKKQCEEVYQSRLSNIVFMGMGEPLLNYENVNTAIEKITTIEGLEMSPRRITLSTVGIVKKIYELANDNIKYNLAVSLHAATNEKRNKLMPLNQSNPLEELAKALKFFNKKTGGRITFEYLMLLNENDGLEDARALAQFCKNVPCKVNLIEYNSTGDIRFRKTTEQRMKLFYEFIESKNIIVNIRASKGQDIDAACGQLANIKNHE